MLATMPIDLPLLPLGSWFPQGSWPQLPCGSCATGALRVSRPTEIDASARYRDHPDWDPEWIRGYFTSEAECMNPDCRSVGLVTGRMKVDADVDERGHWHGDYDTFYRVTFCDPPLRLVAAPTDTPDDVKRAIHSAALVIWADASCAANRLRAAVEHLLTHLDVPRNGSSAHERIKRLAAKRPDVATVLEAVKWIGNDGSHGELPLKDVLEGAALLERALAMVYDTSAEELHRLAKAINAERRAHKTRASSAKQARES